MCKDIFNFRKRIDKHINIRYNKSGQTTRHFTRNIPKKSERTKTNEQEQEDFSRDSHGIGEYHSDTYVIDRETFEVVEKTYFTSYFTEAEYEIEAEEGIFDYNSGAVYVYYDEINTEEHKDLLSPLADWTNKLRTVTVIFGEYRDDGKLEYTRFTFKIPGTWEYLPHEAYNGKYAVFMDKAATKKYVYPGSNKSYTIYVLPFEAN